MIPKFFDKFPAEIIEFELDCSDILIGGDTIQSVTVTSTDLTISNESFLGPLVKFRCAGGTAGKVSLAIANVTTTAGLFRQSPAYIVIKPLGGA